MSDYMGPYRLLKLVMSGSSSQIWEVMNDKTRERYAIKFLRTEFRQDKEHINFLKHEYEVGKELDHPNIIKMVELDSEKKSPYVVMELYPVLSLKLMLGNKGVKGLIPLMQKDSSSILKRHSTTCTRKDGSIGTLSRTTSSAAMTAM